MTTERATETRTFQSALVGLCAEPECGVYMEPYQRRDECPMGCERPGARLYDQQFRLLKKRRMMICSHCLAALVPKFAERHNCDDYEH